MNEVKVNVRFKTGIIYKTSTKLVTNDYNSTKLIFDFDIPDGIKIFELKDPNDKTIFVDEIKNNEIVLVAKANVTTQKDGIEVKMRHCSKWQGIIYLKLVYIMVIVN